MLIDTHCHLNHERFADDIPGAIERAANAGVDRMIVVGFDLASSELAVRISNEFAPTVFAAVAAHPHDAKSWDAAAEERIRTLANDSRVVAVGEIGLDFHYDFSPRENQYTAFRAQIAIARDVGLPIIIHCREAYPEALAVLADERANGIGAVMHCWGGSPEEARRTVALGLHLGFGGTLTFKTADNVRDAARDCPSDRILVETDAPYLAPVPLRGKRCEPAYVRLVAELLAELRGATFEEIAATTTTNALKLFPRMNAG